jgi:hypothetical protein
MTDLIDMINMMDIIDMMDMMDMVDTQSHLLLCFTRNIPAQRQYKDVDGLSTLAISQSAPLAGEWYLVQ